MHFLLQWIDLVWLPLSFFLVNKNQRWTTVAVLVGCMVIMRLQAELFEWIGYPRGLLGMLDMPAYSRGLVFYSILYAIFLLIVYRSTHLKGSLLLSMGLGFLFAGFMLGIFVMMI